MPLARQLQPKEEEIREEVGALVSTANNLIVSNTAEKEGAVLFVRGINDSIKKVVSFFKPMKEAAAAAHKAVVAREKETLNIPEQAKRITLAKVTEYDWQQEQIRQAAEAKAREDARKKHDAALKKAQAKIDKIMERAGDGQETIDLINMELNNDLPDVERQKLEYQLNIEIAKLESNQERVEAIQQPAYVMTAVMPKTERVKGAVVKTIVEMSVTNPMAVIRQVADGLLPMSCVKINEAEIKRVIKQNEGSKKIYPGIAYKFVKTTHVR